MEVTEKTIIKTNPKPFEINVEVVNGVPSAVSVWKKGKEIEFAFDQLEILIQSLLGISHAVGAIIGETSNE